MPTENKNLEKRKRPSVKVIIAALWMIIVDGIWVFIAATAESDCVLCFLLFLPLSLLFVVLGISLLVTKGKNRWIYSIAIIISGLLSMMITIWVFSEGVTLNKLSILIYIIPFILLLSDFKISKERETVKV